MSRISPPRSIRTTREGLRYSSRATTACQRSQPLIPCRTRRRRVGPLAGLLGKATATDRDFAYIDPSGLITANDGFPLRQRHYRAGHGDNHHPRCRQQCHTDSIGHGPVGSDRQTYRCYCAWLPSSALALTSPVTVALFGDGAWKALPTPLDDIYDWAHQGNTDVIPIGKLGTGTLPTTRRSCMATAFSEHLAL